MLLVHSVAVNWSTLRDLPESSEFKLAVRSAKATRKADFERFEDLVGSISVLRSVQPQYRYCGWH